MEEVLGFYFDILASVKACAIVLFYPISQDGKKRSNSGSKRLAKGHEEMNL